MSGAQPKAASIAGVISITAEINKKATETRCSQGWVDELIEDLDILIERVRKAKANKETVSITYQGNVVDLWEHFAENDVVVELSSDQTSLHNPWARGYYPVDLTLEESNDMMANNPDLFKEKVQDALKRHCAAVNKCVEKFDTYFFVYGNAFLLEASRAGADILNEKCDFKYPSYMQDIMGLMCFDYAFGPFGGVYASNDSKYLVITDEIACEVLEEIKKTAPNEIQQQLADNIHWIKEAGNNQMVVGSQACILYADCVGRTKKK